MLIGITEIGVYIPPDKIDNLSIRERFGLSEEFITQKIGMHSLSRKPESARTSDLCVAAFEDLRSRHPGLDLDNIDFIAVCTQTGDYPVPHTSAIVQGKLGLPTNCAAFDLSLGCSGYPYLLSVAMSFMELNDFKSGLVFTADPYSEIIDESDKDTALLFGDAATVTLVSAEPLWELGKTTFYSDGNYHDCLIKRGQYLYMDGRRIFNFVMQNVPNNIEECLTKNHINKEAIDLYLLHPGSKYLVENLIKRLGIAKDKAPFSVKNYGNTISSSLPIMLKEYIHDSNIKNILMSGFGVGLSAASTIIKRRK